MKSRTVPEDVMLSGLEKYIYDVEEANTDDDYFVLVPHQDLHWLTQYVRRLRGDTLPLEPCGDRVRRYPVGHPKGISTEQFVAGIQKALDDAVEKRRGSADMRFEKPR